MHGNRGCLGASNGSNEVLVRSIGQTLSRHGRCRARVRQTDAAAAKWFRGLLFASYEYAIDREFAKPDGLR